MFCCFPDVLVVAIHKHGRQESTGQATVTPFSYVLSPVIPSTNGHFHMASLRMVCIPYQPHARDVEAPTKVTHAGVRREARRWWIGRNTRIGESVSGGSIPRGFHSNDSLCLSRVCLLTLSLTGYAECVCVVVCVRVFWSTG